MTARLSVSQQVQQHNRDRGGRYQRMWRLESESGLPATDPRPGDGVVAGFDTARLDRYRMPTWTEPSSALLPNDLRDEFAGALRKLPLGQLMAIYREQTHRYRSDPYGPGSARMHLPGLEYRRRTMILRAQEPTEVLEARMADHSNLDSDDPVILHDMRATAAEMVRRLTDEGSIVDVPGSSPGAKPSTEVDELAARWHNDKINLSTHRRRS